MSTKIINLSLHPELISLIDAEARREYSSRSEYIKRIIMADLQAKNVLEPELLKRTADDVRREQLKSFLEEYAKEDTLDKSA